jgi:phosphoribosylformylglycinamidine (FGAM) synthase-like enzyme
MKNQTLFAAMFAMVSTAIVLMAFTSEKKEEVKKEYMQFTTVESVVPGGLGRSRMITTIDGESNMSNKFEEIQLRNFYSLVGINFGNIRDNDRIITQKITQYTSQDWNLEQVTSGVESSPEKTGIFITRYLFSRSVSN